MLPNRIHWMDSLRGLAMLIVILYHSTYGVQLALDGMHPVFERINGALGPYRMPALFLLSGMLVERSLAKGAGRYVSGKLRHIAWPYLIWMVITEFSRDGRFSGADLLRDLGPFEPTLWFLWYLLAFYLFHLLVHRVHPAALALAAIGLSLIFATGQPMKLAYMYAFFAVGVLVGRHLDRFDALVRRPATAIALLLPVGYVTWVSAVHGGVRFEPLLAPWVLCGVVGLAWICAFAERWRRVSAPLEFVGRHSIVFYLVQWPLILFLVRIEALREIDRSVVLVPLVAVATVVVATIVALLSQRFAVVSALFAFPVLERRAAERERVPV